MDTGSTEIIVYGLLGLLALLCGFIPSMPTAGRFIAGLTAALAAGTAGYLALGGSTPARMWLLTMPGVLVVLAVVLAVRGRDTRVLQPLISRAELVPGTVGTPRRNRSSATPPPYDDFTDHRAARQQHRLSETPGRHHRSSVPAGKPPAQEIEPRLWSGPAQPFHGTQATWSGAPTWPAAEPGGTVVPAGTVAPAGTGGAGPVGSTRPTIPAQRTAPPQFRPSHRAAPRPTPVPWTTV